MEYMDKKKPVSRHNSEIIVEFNQEYISTKINNIQKYKIEVQIHYF